MTWLFSSSVRYIPYAAPPTGALRRQPPQPASAWKDGSRAAPRCPQNGNPADSNPVGTAEDCLYLNVTAPRTASGRRLPVMVWLHGGGFTQGSGGDYDAQRLARPGAVVVTVNYRPGVFGFLGHRGLAGSGAFGLLDQQAALVWVRHNAAAFGDPHNVTLFGESAGAFSTCAQLTSPAATGLFDKAITQNGGCSMRQLGIDPAGGDTIWPSPAGRRAHRRSCRRAGRMHGRDADDALPAPRAHLTTAHHAAEGARHLGTLLRNGHTAAGAGQFPAHRLRPGREAGVGKVSGRRPRLAFPGMGGHRHRPRLDLPDPRGQPPLRPQDRRLSVR
ncbi:carboxylesterase family protein [Nonomuraea sp. NPDC049625]|uniref:carboxylesterase family protein n=1 Tax=Nonomuraea sp. NPDC049625 TaxID=3155775 RepID=UPI00342D5C51